MLRLMERTLALTVVEQTQDQDLVRKAREGSRAAFDVLFQRHKQFVYNVCYHMLGSADDAVDATQAAFIQAYRAIRRFRGEAAFRSWLYRIAVNVCTRMLKRERRRSLLMLRSESPAAGAASGDRVWEGRPGAPSGFQGGARAVLLSRTNMLRNSRGPRMLGGGCANEASPCAGGIQEGI